MKQLGAILVWLGVGLGLSALFWPQFWRGEGLIGGDLYTYFLPQKVFFAEHLANGEWPLWNNWVGHGYPIVGESQTGVFYPPNGLMYPFLDVTTAYNLLQILHYALGFGFSVALARSYGFSNLASAWVGIVFIYGWFPARITLEWAIITGAWMPAALYCLEKFLTTQRWRMLAGLALVLAMQMLAGHFHLAFITQVLLIAYAAGRIFLIRPQKDDTPHESLPFAHRFRSLGLIVLAIGIGFGLAAVQLAPSWELKTLSQRSKAGTYYDPGYGHVPPWYLKQIVVPFLVYGTIDDLNNHLPAGSSQTNVIEAHMYFGLLPVAVLLYGLCTGVYWRDRRWWLWLILGLLALVCATGSLVAFTKFLPGFDYFRGIGRWGIVTTLAVAILSGAALDAWRTRRRSRRMPAIIMSILILLTIWDLRIVWGWVGEGVGFRFLENPPIEHRENSPIRKLLREFPEPVRLFSRGPNLPTLLGVASTPVYLGIGPDEYFDPKTAMPEPLPFDEPPTEEQIDWLQRAGVTHVLSFSELDEWIWPVNFVWSGYDPLLCPAWARGLNEPLFLYELIESRGRASWHDPASSNPKPIIQEITANRVMVEAEAIEAGTLVLTDLAYPGWQVMVDGQPADWRRIDGMYRGVELPTGKHTVIWEYRPTSQRWGFLISGMTGLVIAATTILRYRWSKRNSTANEATGQ